MLGLNIKQPPRILLIFIFLGSPLKAQSQVRWTSSSDLPQVQSDILSPVGSSFDFSLGTFRDDFLPTRVNRDEWSLHWEEFGSTNQGGNGSNFSGSKTLLTNAEPFTLTRPVYLWCSDGDFVGSEHLLVSGGNWRWPDTGSGSAEADFDLATLDPAEAIVGVLNRGSRHFRTEIKQGGRSFQAWVAANFTPMERRDPFIVGQSADPDLDGRSNLAEFLAGSLPGDGLADFRWHTRLKVERDGPSGPLIRFGIALPTGSDRLARWELFESTGGLDGKDFNLIPSRIEQGEPDQEQVIFKAGADPLLNRCFRFVSASPGTWIKNPLAHGVTARITMDEVEGAPVESLQGLPVTFENDPERTPSGFLGQARTFVKSERDRMTIGDSDLVHPINEKSFGVSLWYQANALTGGSSCLLSQSDESGIDWMIWITDTQIRFGVTRRSGGMEVLVFDHTLEVSEWTHLAAHFDIDDPSLSLSLNGKVVTSKPAFLGVRRMGRPIHLGYGKVSGMESRNYFDGQIDEVLFWSGPRAAQVIELAADLEAAGHPFPYPGHFEAFHRRPRHRYAGISDPGGNLPDVGSGRVDLRAQGTPVLEDGAWRYNGTGAYHFASGGEVMASPEGSLLVAFRADGNDDRAILGCGDPETGGFALALEGGRLVLDYHAGSGRTRLVGHPSLPTTPGVQGCLLNWSAAGVSMRVYGLSPPVSGPPASEFPPGEFTIGKGKFYAAEELNYFSGRVFEVRIDHLAMTARHLKDAVEDLHGVECWGDSLTSAMLGGGGSDWPGILSQLRGGIGVGRHAFPGEGSPQIREHFERFNKHRNRLHIIWSGNNSFLRGVQSECEEIARVIGQLETDRFLVVGLPNRTSLTQTDAVIAEIGTKHAEINTELARIYGDRFVDFQKNIQDDYVPVDPDDSDDLSRQIMPRSMRDMAGTRNHLSTVGAEFLARVLKGRLELLGWGVD